MWLLLPVCLLSLSVALLMHDWTETPKSELVTCGYTSCNQHEKDVLNVHIVAHTHNDVGWVRTVDEYYNGTGRKKKVMYPAVRNILDSVVKELWKDPRRRFTYVESYFFFKWWKDQNNTVKQKVHKLVQEGRLQFAGGAWSMNDEASTHYQSIIDQFTLGLRHLNDTFGYCGMPTVGWQIDPFGHSREFVSLLAAMGFDGVFLGRIDYQDKANRIKKKTMEMLWRGDDDLGEPSDLFAGVLYNLYLPPSGFCFDQACLKNKPLIDEGKVAQFLQYVANMSEAYTTNNLLLTMGGDFHYDNATAWFYYLDQLIQKANAKAGSKINVFYSTPQCYLKAVNDANPALPTKQDDFFPYAHQPHEYWTGHYTSRPSAKYFEREANRYLQMAKQLQVLGDLKKQNLLALDELNSALGIMQHHDAITGTEKQHVANDYDRILDRAIEDSLVIPRQAFNKFMQGDAAKPPILSHERCRLNESSCAASEESNQFVVTLYNLLAWEVKEPVRIPVTKGNFEVYDPKGDKITSQLVDIPPQILNIPTRKSKATHEIIFIANLQPVSYKAFYVRKIIGDDASSNIMRDKDASRNILRGNDASSNNIQGGNTIRDDDDSSNTIQIIKKKIRKRSVVNVRNKNVVLFKENNTYNDDDKHADEPNITKNVNNDNYFQNTTISSVATETNTTKYIDDAITPTSLLEKLNKTNNTNYDNNLKSGDASVATDINKYIDNMVTPKFSTDKPNQTKTNDGNELKNNNTTVLTDINKYIDDIVPPISVTDRPKQTKNANHDNNLKNNDTPVGIDKNKYTNDTVTIMSVTDKPKTKKNLNGHTHFKNATVASVATDIKKSSDELSPIRLPGKAHSRVRKPLRLPAVPEIHMDNQHMKLRVNPPNQIIYVSSADGVEVLFKVQFCSYDTKYSGAYIFRPNKTIATKISQIITEKVVGDVVNEIRIDTQDNKSSVIRIYDGLNFIENDWVVGPINNTVIGKEVVLRYDTDVLSYGEFYTDSNGRQMLKRRLSCRPQWNLTLAEPVSGNYYPIVNEIYIRDNKVKFAVITDRAEGGTSLNEGQVEIMVHRRLVRDDNQGVTEVLNETVMNGIGLVVRGRHRIFLSRICNGDARIEEKKNVFQVDSQPLVFVSDAKSLNLQEWLELNNEYSWANALPDGIHLLTLEHWKDNKILLRLENYLELTDSENTEIEIDLQLIFKTIDLESFRETTLAANQWLEDVRGSLKMQYETNGFQIKLKAKQIRTFVIDSWSLLPLSNSIKTFSSLSGVESAFTTAMKNRVLVCLCCPMLMKFLLQL